jgi:hypothetical protein
MSKQVEQQVVKEMRFAVACCLSLCHTCRIGKEMHVRVLLRSESCRGKKVQMIHRLLASLESDSRQECPS